MEQIFTYQAVDRSGAVHTGTRAGESKEEVIRALQAEGLFLLKITAGQKQRWAWGRKIRKSELMTFTRQLASLLEAGLKIDQALSLVATLLGKTRLAVLVSELEKMVQEGAAFSQALERYENVFGQVYVTLIKAGERAGMLPAVLNRLAGTLEEEDELRKDLTNSLIYPVFVTIVSGVATFVLIQVVVPTFAQLFIKSGQELPGLTRMVIAFSNRLPACGLAFLFLLLGLAVWYIYGFRSNSAKLAWDRLQLAIPVIGPLRLRLALARFARMLSLMLKSGVRLVEGLFITKDVMGNTVLNQLIGEAAIEVSKGGSLARFFGRSDRLPALAKQMVAIGEETGNLGEILGHLARFYEQEIRAELKNMVALLGPVLILFLTGVVFLIVVAVLLPIINVPFFE